MKKLFLSMLPVFILLGCSQEVQTESEITSRPAKFFHVKSGVNDKWRSFPAVVEASEDATLAFRVSGVIEELLVKPGQPVAKGDLLAKLDPTDYLIRVEQAKANFELAESQFGRSQQLLKQKLISPSMFDEAQAQLQVARASLKTAKKNLQYTELYAPFEGEVARTYVENFENVVAKQVILNIQDRESIDIAIQVPENFIANVRKDTGYQPTVTFDPKPEFSYKATIKEWDTTADPVTNTFRVVFSLKRPPEFNVLPGMTASLKAELDKVTFAKSDAIVVPTTAVFSEVGEGDASQFVWKVIGDGNIEKV